MTGNENGEIKYFQIIDGQIQVTNIKSPHAGPVWSVCLSQNKTPAVLVSGGHDGVVCIWNLDQDKSPKFMDKYPLPVTKTLINEACPEDDIIEVLAGCTDGSIKIYHRPS